MPDSSNNAAALEYLRRVPKVELHVHLEGAVRRERLVAILSRHGRQGEARDLDRLFHHANFAEFLDHFRFVVTSLRDVQDVHDVALDLFRDLAAQNTQYAEVIFSASIFTRTGMPLGELLAAVAEAERTALAAAPAGSRYNLVIDLVRNFGPESALRLVEDLAREAHPSVVGVHLGGDEVGFPGRLFANAFRAARQAGLGLAAHAGEGDGPASVRDAIERLGVRRIGHGVRSVEDPGLVREIARRGIALEICPTSNVCTGIIESLEAHPLPALLAQGVAVTLGSDDPSFFDTDLVRELQAAHTRMGLALEPLERILDAGLLASFLPEEERQSRLQALRAPRQALRRELGLPHPE